MTRGSQTFPSSSNATHPLFRTAQRPPKRGSKIVHDKSDALDAQEHRGAPPEENLVSSLHHPSCQKKSLNAIVFGITQNPKYGDRTQDKGKPPRGSRVPDAFHASHSSSASYASQNIRRGKHSYHSRWLLLKTLDAE